MTDQERIELQKNNPLHGLKLETLLQELVDFYGWDILDTAMRFNCFHTKPSIASSVKYLNKTEWAREKLENFYLYRLNACLALPVKSLLSRHAQELSLTAYCLKSQCH